MQRRIGASIAEDDLAVRTHLVEQEAQAFVRLELRRETLSMDGDSVVGLDLYPSEAKELGQKLLARADGAAFWTLTMARRRTKHRFPFSLLQNERIMRPAHILGFAVGVCLCVFSRDFYLFELGFFVMVANALGIIFHSSGRAPPQDQDQHK